MVQSTDDAVKSIVVRPVFLGHGRVKCWAGRAMIENPYESPHAEPSASAVPSPAGSRSVRLSVFFVNCFLLVLFPPTCCPCGFGPLGFIIQPYLMLLGFPTVLLGFLAPDAINANRAAFFAAYIVNYVVVSYLIGELAGRLLLPEATVARVRPVIR